MTAAEYEPTVYFDESGNSGAALLDHAQPTFCLASVDYSPDECEELLAPLRSSQDGEIKFSTLRKSPRGKRKVLEFFASKLHSQLRAKTVVMHKRYMVVCKLVDLIEETLAYEAGLDLYKNGANIALANLHFYVSPVFCGPHRFDDWLDSFVQLVRARDAAARSRFINTTCSMYDNCANMDHKPSLAPYIFGALRVDDILDGISFTTLDPAIPSFFYLCTVWGAQFGKHFVALHDASKPLARERRTLEAMMDPTIEPALIGYDRRKFEFPVKVRELRFGNSRNFSALQVADIFASATAYRANAIATSQRDEFSEELRKLSIERFVVDAVWPSTDVTPERLGTHGGGGVSAPDHMAKVLADAKGKGRA